MDAVLSKRKSRLRTKQRKTAVPLSRAFSKESQSKNFLAQVTEDLKREGLWNERRLECFGGKSDIASTFSTKDKAFDLPKTEVFLETPQDMAVFLYKIGSDPETLSCAIRDDLNNIKTSSSIFCGGAWDLKHSHLKDLFNQGHFDEKEAQTTNEKHQQLLLKTTAYLMIAGITTENSHQGNFAKTNSSEFCRLSGTGPFTN